MLYFNEDRFFGIMIDLIKEELSILTHIPIFWLNIKPKRRFIKASFMQATVKLFLAGSLLKVLQFILMDD